jgi:hypothetical protein
LYHTSIVVQILRYVLFDRPGGKRPNVRDLGTLGSQVAMPQTLHLFASRQQLVELTLIRDPPVLEHDDLVGAAQSHPTV